MLTSREAKELSALTEARGRKAPGRFLAEGVRVVEDLLASDVRVAWAVTASSLVDGDRGRRLAAEIDRRGIPRRVVGDREFGRLAATETPQGAMVVAEVPGWRLEAVALRSPAAPVVLLLDAVQDPGNVGTLIRSAEALGAAAVVALPGTADPWSPKAVRSAAGSSFRLPVLRANWEEARHTLAELGFAFLGAAAEGEPVEPGAGRRLGLVVGNEGAGLSPALRAGLDALVAVPIRGRAESLNVAAAAAILLYELTR